MDLTKDYYQALRYFELAAREKDNPEQNGFSCMMFAWLMAHNPPHIHADEITAMLKVLRKDAQMASLDLSDHALKDDGENEEDYGLSILVKMLLENNSSLKNLKLSNNSLDDIEIEIIVTALQKNTILEHLNLSNNNVGEAGLEMLTRELKNTHITKLSLDAALPAELSLVLKQNKIKRLRKITMALDMGIDNIMNSNLPADSIGRILVFAYGDTATTLIPIEDLMPIPEITKLREARDDIKKKFAAKH